MNLGKAITRAVKTNDAALAGRIADVLRFKHGYSYEDVQNAFCYITNCTPAAVEALMYEVDYYND